MNLHESAGFFMCKRKAPFFPVIGYTVPGKDVRNFAVILKSSIQWKTQKQSDGFWEKSG